jgi:predicted HD superfamily hydrolase involved in NAD metabolism
VSHYPTIVRMPDRRKTISLDSVDTFVRSRLSERRYSHSVRVADGAERLATLHGLDARRARLAALLHDAAREVGKENLLQLAQEWDIPVGEPEREHPNLLHGPVAAEIASRELGVEDGEIIEAIRVHTVGEAGMSPLALAVFLADKIEPARDYPGVGLVRKLAEEDLRAAAAEALRHSRDHNEQRGRSTHPSSLKALEWLEDPPDERV